MLSLVTVFLGCGFASKYREGGGNFSVPLQWMLGLRRLGQDAIWLELLPATSDRAADGEAIATFPTAAPPATFGGPILSSLPGGREPGHDLAAMRCVGLTKREVRARSAGPNVLLNLAYSLYPPFLLELERRVFCDLDPSEIFFGCLAKFGWRLADSHWVAQTPPEYRRYLASATAEFTAIKGVDVSWRAGWVSDRAAASRAGPAGHYRGYGSGRLPAGGKPFLFRAQRRGSR
ncbi:MAG: hypothetical protein ACR2II_08390 [Chthoniobacterales bacterium]